MAKTVKDIYDEGLARWKSAAITTSADLTPHEYDMLIHDMYHGGLCDEPAMSIYSSDIQSEYWRVWVSGGLFGIAIGAIITLACIGG